VGIGWSSDIFKITTNITDTVTDESHEISKGKRDFIIKIRYDINDKFLVGPFKGGHPLGKAQIAALFPIVLIPS
jgi:hypothetical protein